VSSPLAVKEVTTQTPTPAPVSAEKAGDEPKVGVPQPALVGLSTVQAQPGAKKKRPSQKQRKKAGGVAPVQVGAVEGGSDEGGSDEPEAVPVPTVVPVLSPEERRTKVATLTPDDQIALAADWGLTVESEKFITVMRSEQRYQYFLLLSSDERAFVTTKQIEKRLKPPAVEVAKHALQQRLLTLATITTADYAHLEATWGMPRSAPQFKAAMSQESSYQMFCKVPAALRTIVSGKRIKKGTLLDADEVIAARAKKAEIQKAEAEALAAEQALAKNTKKLAASKATFEMAATALRLRIAARVTAEIPDFVWEEEFAKSVGAGRGKVAQGALAPRQGKQVGDHWDSAIDEAKKVRDVNAAVGSFDRLAPWTLKEIKDDVLADTSQTSADFIVKARAALSAQRNPSDIDKWKSWMQLTMYPKYKKLKAQEGFAVHFTVAANSLTLPALVTPATTAAQLLNSLFRAPSGEKMDEAHVSVETGIYDGDTPKNPHKYWRDGATEYELYFGKGLDRTARWGPDKEERDIKNALDAAMKEAYDALLERAEYVLAQAGRL
jgi:hypothetical protein